jgi:hypothetical protein
LGREALRTRIQRISLIGTERSFQFEPGLNIVTGPITSGKTSLLRLCRGLFGGGLEDLPPEVRQHVNAIGGEIVIGETRYSVVRPNVTTSSAKVEVAGDGEAHRLPASQLDETSALTYNQWLLGKLGLPRLEVPSAPTRVESVPTPVSINDYFLYCDLTQDEIDNSVFGHRNQFKNIKRKYVFEILYGLYSAKIANLQEELREVYIEIRQLQSQSKAFERFLTDTPWENRAALEESLANARDGLRELEVEMTKAAQSAFELESSGVQVLRRQLQAIEATLAELSRTRDHESSNLQQLRRLATQLETQSERLTRSIVADVYLTDFDFVVCPRCGASLDSDRANPGKCYVCLQAPTPGVTREELIHEQDRIGAQILETRELISSREDGISRIQKELTEMERARHELAHEIDLQLRSYVSDAATEIARRATKRAEVQSNIRRFEDYLRLYNKLDKAVGDLSALERRRREIEGALDGESVRRADAEGRIQRLEAKFEEIVEAFGVPRFGDMRRAAIDRVTYLPVLDGRRFDELSSQGLQVLLNVAHALAHHLVALELGTPLPGILFIDGLTSNVGHEGFDLQRVHDVYGYLGGVSQRHGEQLQLIVADNDVPLEAQEFIRVRLSEDRRLIPMPGPDRT